MLAFVETTLHLTVIVLPKESTVDNPNPMLKPKAVPSQFSWNRKCKDGEEINITCARRALQRQKKQETATLPSITEEIKMKSEEISLIFTDDIKIKSENGFIEIEIEDSRKDASVQCSLCNCDVKSLKYDIADLPEYVSRRKSKLNIFYIENLKDKPEIVQFYTGFDDYNHFMFVFNLFGDEVNNLKYYPALQPSRGKHTLSPCDEFYLTLIKLRRNMSNTELSFHFGISKSVVSDYFITWISYLYSKFKDLNLWLPKKTIDENVMFKKKTRAVVIDCTQTRIQKPQYPSTNSNWKSANTIKVVVGISSTGSVNFISDAYHGSISDIELFKICGINNHQKCDTTLGGHGLKIQDPLSHMDTTVKIPELKTQELGISKKVSSEHINVEHVIGLGRTYQILNDLAYSWGGLGGKIMFVCFMLVNFKRNIM